MKQIVLFSQRYLHNGEHDQLHTNIATEIKTQTAKKLGIETETETYKAALANEKQALQAELGSAYTLKINESDGNRDDLDLGFSMFVESHLHHPDPEIQGNARKVLRIIRQYGNLRKINYNDESSQLTNRNAEIIKNYAAELTSLGNGWATQWLNALEESNNQFIALFGNRADEQTNKLVINTLEARVATDAAWEVIARRVNALAIVNGDTAYAAFIDKVNYYIDYNKNLVNARKGRKDSGDTTADEGK
jgi:hypothetical protein